MKSKALLAMMAVIGSILATSSPVAAQQTCGGEPITIFGTAGDDTISGTNGPDVIFAAQGDDFISALGGDDIVCAGRGDDIVLGGGGFDILFGAQGDDQLYAANFGTSQDARADTRGARMFGGAGNDEIYGSDRWDRMQGGAGMDILYGFEGRDWMRGGTDRDFVNGGLGIDDLHGGNGADRIEVNNGDSVRGGNGIDFCVVRGQQETFVSCGRNRFEPGARSVTLAGGGVAHDVPQDAPFGYYRVGGYFELNDADGAIVVNDFVIDSGPTIAIVDPRGTSVEFRTRATRLQTAPRINPLTLDDGRALIGYDLAPGTYRVTPTDAVGRGSMLARNGFGDLMEAVSSADGPVTLEVTGDMVFLDWTGRLELVS